jgi:hypothetical protein
MVVITRFGSRMMTKHTGGSEEVSMTTCALVRSTMAWAHTSLNNDAGSEVSVGNLVALRW